METLISIILVLCFKKLFLRPNKQYTHLDTTLFNFRRLLLPICTMIYDSHDAGNG